MAMIDRLFTVRAHNLTDIADAIRYKLGTDDTLSFPDDFVDGIYDIEGEGEGEHDPEWYYSVPTEVHNYMTQAAITYQSSSSSIVGNYHTDTTRYDDTPVAYELDLTDFNFDISDASYIILVNTRTGTSFMISLDGETEVYNITGLIPSCTYTCFIYSEYEEELGRFDILDWYRNNSEIHTGLRMINLTGEGRNCRDLGGKSVSGGGIKYGLMFRGQRLSGSSGAKLSDEDVIMLHDELKIKSEVDFRSSVEFGTTPNKSFIGDDVFYNRYILDDGYTQYFSLDADTIGVAKEIIEKIMDNVIMGLPTYFHCVAGADRTGTVASILEGVCGVSDVDIDIDFELTTFNLDTTRVRNGSRWSGWKTYINSLGGDNPWITWCLGAGISLEKINKFRRAAIDGVVEDIPPQRENVLVSSINQDGTTYNEGIGYKSGVRLNSQSVETSTSETQYCTTGYIPVRQGDTLIFEGMKMYASSTATGYRNGYCKNVYYNSSFGVIYNTGNENLNKSDNNPVVDGDLLTQVTINTIGSGRDISDLSYVRFTFEIDGVPKIYKISE